MSIDAAMKALAALLLNQAEGREGKVSKSVLFHQLESEGHKRSDLEGAVHQMKASGLIGVRVDSSVIQPEPYHDWPGSLGQLGEVPRRVVPEPQTTSWGVIWPERQLWESWERNLRGARPQLPDVERAPPRAGEAEAPGVQAAGATARAPTTATGNSPLASKDLAAVLGPSVSSAAVDSFLRRHRAKYPDCFITVDDDDRRRNQPKYLYHVAEVMPALKAHFRV
jgi:hypothetical protein